MGKQPPTEIVTYEDALDNSQENPNVADFIETQNASLKRKGEVIIVLTDMQKYIGGLMSIFLTVLLYLSYRKTRKKQPINFCSCLGL
tara:strand:+ start:3378 stop:3638 length:261 start_codon:yes stop_codon:yes gene_type:complete